MADGQIPVALLYSQRLHIGGVETHLLSLIHHQDPLQYRWLIVAPASDDFAAQARPARAVAWAASRAYDLRAWLNLVRILRRERVQLVHAHNPRAAFYGGLAAGWLGLPMLVTVHLPAYYWVRGQTWPARFRRWAYQQVEKNLYRWLTDQIIYVSERVYDEARRLGLVPDARAQVIANGIESQLETGQVTHATAIPPIAPGVRVLCCVARLETQKGIDILLDALHLVRVRNWRLWLAGDGPQLPNLQAQARQLGLEHLIDFLGFRTDVPRLLRASDIFVLPSRYEAMSIALLEALAAGCPCVVTDVGENATIIKNDVNGFVIASENPQQLAGALERLLGDTAVRERLGQAARQSATMFDANHMRHQLQMVYASLLTRRP